MSDPIDLRLDRIRMDGATQSRVALSSEWAAEIAELVRPEPGKKSYDFPPVVVFWDGQYYWLASGFHRCAGYTQAGRLTIPAEKKLGTVRDARLFSVQCNRLHGLKSNAMDRRKAVIMLLADAEWVRWSDRKIAGLCGVSHSTVGIYREQIREAENGWSIRPLPDEASEEEDDADDDEDDADDDPDDPDDPMNITPESGVKIDPEDRAAKEKQLQRTVRKLIRQYAPQPKKAKE